jgi:hypothetical protein
VICWAIGRSVLVSHEMSLDEAPKGYEIFERKLDAVV